VDPSFLTRAVESTSTRVVELAAVALSRFRHPEARALLLRLCSHEAEAVQEEAVESLFPVHGSSTRSMLGHLAERPVICRFLAKNEA